MALQKLYSFKQLQDEVLRNMDEDTNTSTKTLTLVKNSLQQAHLRRVAARDWNFMLSLPKTFSTALNVQTYILPEDFFRPYYFFNQTTKNYVSQVPSRSLGGSGVRWNTDVGHLTRFVLWGNSPVAAQPLTASKIVCTNALGSDDTQQVTLVGLNSAGGVIGDVLVLNHTTPATSVFTYASLTSITLSQALNGTITFSTLTGGTSLLTLVGGEVAKVYPTFFALSIPNAIDTIEYRYYRQPKPLVADVDIPDIPPPFQQILVWDALIDIGTYNSDTTDGDLQVWRKNQQDLEDALILADDDQNALEGESRYVRYIGEEPDQPRVFTT